MHPNEELLAKLFQCLNAHDYNGMASCYHEQATFQDIAFTLKNEKQIHAMWDMICSDDPKGVKSDIKATVQELSADDNNGRVVVVDAYSIRPEKKRKVQNQIVSTFEFRGGKVIKQIDECDPVSWAQQAIGGFGGFIAGRVGFVRRAMAMKKLRRERPQAFS